MNERSWFSHIGMRVLYRESLRDQGRGQGWWIKLKGEVEVAVKVEVRKKAREGRKERKQVTGDSGRVQVSARPLRCPAFPFHFSTFPPHPSWFD